MRANPFSLMTYITASLALIIGVGVLTIFISFWVTELADQDAQAINLSGSMRMQTYHIGLALKQEQQTAALQRIDNLDKTWNHSLFNEYRGKLAQAEVGQRFSEAYGHWRDTLQPELLDIARNSTNSARFPDQAIEHQVELTDQFVHQIQLDAEAKIRNLRAFQLLSLFITIAIGSGIFYLAKNRIEKPLMQLTEAAHRIGKGEYGRQVDIEGRDELALLGNVINQMSYSINAMYEEMDERVRRRTLELHRNNVALEFLFNTARTTLDKPDEPLDYQNLLDDLSEALGKDLELELCLFTPAGDRPYLQLTPSHARLKDCSERSCDECQGDAPFIDLEGVSLSSKFPIVHDANHLGVISVKTQSLEAMESWKEQLLRSVADQFALSISLSAQKDQERRLAMLNERTIIARELHDSLAQALSYLKIQVTRLQKTKDKERYDMQQEIIDELREGLSSAYRQLRELLTTFRLKMDAGGLEAALQGMVNTLKDRADIELQLHYRLTNLPLSPTEEIHLLQIVKEATQNAVSHSQGDRVDIHLRQLENEEIELIVEDNGIGISNSPEKLNHYGLAIMNERSRHLGGQVEIQSRDDSGGTRVAFRFVPHFLSQRESA